MRITLSSIGILALLIGYSQATPANHDSATAPFSRRNAGQKLAEPLEVILGSKRETGMGLEVVDAQDSTTRSGLTTTSTWDYPGERFGGDKDDDYQVFGKVRFSKVPDKPQEMRLRAIEPEHGFSDSDCWIMFDEPLTVKELHFPMPASGPAEGVWVVKDNDDFSMTCVSRATTVE